MAYAFAYDREPSVRSYDRDGRLHLEAVTISKAQISEYRGAEIPEAQALGLDPSRTYRLLRPAKELMKALPTLAGCPVLSSHIPVTPNDHKPGAVVGAVMGDARFLAPLLVASLVIWEAQAILKIEDGSCEAISAGYRFEAIMTPCSFEGERADGMMKNIAYNHCALVPAGRIGPDSVIGDAAPPWLAEEIWFRRFRRFFAA